MKSNLLASLLFVVALSGTGCLKNAGSNGCTDKLVSSEVAAMQTYATNNGMTASTHSSGIMYQVINPGSGVTPTGTSRVFVKYTGKYISNNNTFDSQADHTQTGWFLNTLIPGWQIGIPLINEGGIIKLIVPSSLAYGCRGFAAIPPDAILYFEIELVDVQ
jgi:FKBP-type peptidyl-prolyl cis-trans isomerase FkpA